MFTVCVFRWIAGRQIVDGRSGRMYIEPTANIALRLKEFGLRALLCDRKFLSHKTLRRDALLRCHFGRRKSEVHRTSCSLAEMKYMLRIPLGRERVASDSFLNLLFQKGDQSVGKACHTGHRLNCLAVLFIEAD